MTTSIKTNLNTPWSLHFDHDGTEDIAIIHDADGNDLVASHLPCTRIADRTLQTGTFWLPESEGDATPQRVQQMRVMTAAPKLLEALDYLLQQTVDMDLKHGITLSEGEQDARAKALAAIAEATRQD